MNRDQLIYAVQAQMPKQRWEHTVGVMQMAVYLAEQYHADPAKAELAAILHDYAKYWPVEKQRKWILKNKLPIELLDFDKQLWHAPVGADAAEKEFAVTDIEVLDAIRYHTSGRENMTLLDKVVCLADYIEPGRDFPGADHIRELAQESLEQGLIAGFDTTIEFLISQGKKIYPLTLLARNALIEELK